MALAAREAVARTYAAAKEAHVVDAVGVAAARALVDDDETEVEDDDETRQYGGRAVSTA
jgi:hypothetical protein